MNRKVQVLLIEDNEDDVLLTQEAFHEVEGMTISGVARDGRAAFEFLSGLVQERKTLPDVICLDINMPRMNGFEVLEKIKGSPALRHIPVIMLTTSSREEDIHHAYAQGASAYIIKPQVFSKYKEFIKSFAEYWTKYNCLPGNII